MQEATLQSTYRDIELKVGDVVYTPPREGVAPSLVNGLAAVMDYIDAVPKTGRNTFHNYDYVTEDDLTNAVRKALGMQKIMLISGVKEVSAQLVTIKEKDGYSTIVITSHLFVDGISGETLLTHMAGHAAKTDDKGLYACITGAMKYVLQKTFLIPSRNDPETDESAAFVPDEPSPRAHKSAQEDPAVRQRIEREMREIEQEKAGKRNPPARGGVATAAARAGLKAEKVEEPEPEEETQEPAGYPSWCDQIKTHGDMHKGQTFAWIAFHDPASFKKLQTGWHPKPGDKGRIAAPLKAMRDAFDQSVDEPLNKDELQAVLDLQEQASGN